MDVAYILDDDTWLYDNFHLVVDQIALGVVSHSQLESPWQVQVHDLSFGIIQHMIGLRVVPTASKGT